MPAETFFLTALYLAGINLATAIAFAWDKYRAIRDQWRIPERTLLTMAAAGGSIGAVFASQQLRHKTYKEPFRTYLRMILWAHVIIVVLIVAAIGWQAVQSAGGR